MDSKDKLILRKQGNYIRYLGAQKDLSIEEFAKRLDIAPNELRALEGGFIEASDEVIKRLILTCDGSEFDMEKVFGDRYWELCGSLD